MNRASRAFPKTGLLAVCGIPRFENIEDIESRGVLSSITYRTCSFAMVSAISHVIGVELHVITVLTVHMAKDSRHTVAACSYVTVRPRTTRCHTASPSFTTLTLRCIVPFVVPPRTLVALCTSSSANYRLMLVWFEPADTFLLYGLVAARTRDSKSICTTWARTRTISRQEFFSRVLTTTRQRDCSCD